MAAARRVVREEVTGARAVKEAVMGEWVVREAAIRARTTRALRG